MFRCFPSTFGLVDSTSNTSTGQYLVLTHQESAKCELIKQNICKTYHENRLKMNLPCDNLT